MFNQQIVHINDNDYIINPFMGLQGLKIQNKLIKYAGTVITKLNASTEQDVNEEDVFGNIAEILQTLLSGDNEKEITDLIVELVSKVQKNGQPINFDKEFSCNYVTLFELVKEVVMFNYKDVFQKLGIGVN